MRTPLVGWLALHLLPPKASALFVLKNSYYDKKKITKEQVEAYARPIGEPGGRHALLETSKQIIPKSIDKLIAKYPKITVPTLIIWGREDGLTPLADGQRFNKDIAGSKLVVLDQCGHVPNLEKPGEFNAAVLKFLSAAGQ